MVANDNTSSCQEFTVGVPQEVFGPLYHLTCLLGNEVLYCDLCHYTDNATLMKVV